MWQKILFLIAKWCLMRMKREGKLPVGLPGHRDPDYICDVYMPKRPWYQMFNKDYNYQDCQTDGHHLCAQCVHNIANNPPPGHTGPCGDAHCPHCGWK